MSYNWDPTVVVHQEFIQVVPKFVLISSKFRSNREIFAVPELVQLYFKVSGYRYQVLDLLPVYFFIDESWDFILKKSQARLKYRYLHVGTV